jgi:hypothetical protein
MTYLTILAKTKQKAANWEELTHRADDRLRFPATVAVSFLTAHLCP